MIFVPFRTVARLLVLPMLAGAAMLAAAGSCLAQTRTAEDLIVNYDQSQLVKLPRPAAEVGKLLHFRLAEVIALDRLSDLLVLSPDSGGVQAVVFEYLHDSSRFVGFHPIVGRWGKTERQRRPFQPTMVP